uniref:ANK_REP_REGION domain-containing protein n=1 Tax=Bursaphelenchus xylophilus TaxID=6326 RepID=A0A1I7RZQ3_BURXY
MYESNLGPLPLFETPWSRSAKRFLDPILDGGSVSREFERLSRFGRANGVDHRRSRSAHPTILGDMAYRHKPRASSSSHHSVEPSLPDRLASALKSLRPHLNHGQNNNRQKSMVVDADDVVYFANNERMTNSDYIGKGGHMCNETCRHQDQIDDGVEMGNYKDSNPKTRLQSAPPAELKTLDDLRQLYRNVPTSDGDEDLEANNAFKPKRTSSANFNSIELKPPVPSSSPPGSLSPRSPVVNASLTSSLSSSASSSRSAADSGYRSHKRLQKDLENNNTPEVSMVYVNDGSLSSTELLKREKKKAENAATKKITVVQVSQSVSAATQSDIQAFRPEPFKVPFTYTTSDIRQVIEQTVPALSQGFSNEIFMMLLTRFRHSMDLFASEVRRNIGPFVKCAVRDINLTLMSLLPEKIAYVCMDYAVQTLAFFSNSASFSKSLEARASLKMNVGKMYRWMKLSGLTAIVVDVTAVYLTAIFERLLLSYIQNIDKNRGTRSFSEVLRTHSSMFDAFTGTSLMNGICLPRFRSMEKILDVDVPMEDAKSRKWYKRWVENHKLGLRFDADAKNCLFFYVKCNEEGQNCNCTGKRPTFDDWMETLLNLSEHRNTLRITRSDVMETARILKVVDRLPQRPATDFVDSSDCLEWQWLDQTRLWEVDQAERRKILGLCDLGRTNSHGLSCLSRCILNGNNGAANLIVHKTNAHLDTPIAPANLKGPHKNCKLFDDFLGWTPLFWAIAKEDAEMVKKLLAQNVHVNAGWMRRETPLQLAAAVGAPEAVHQLLKHRADAHFTSVDYEHKDQQNVAGAPSALAMAAAAGNSKAFNLVLTELRRPTFSREDLPTSISEGKGKLKDSAEETTQTVNYAESSKMTQLVMREALYYAVECGNLELAFDLNLLGVKWTINLWTKCLEWAVQQKSNQGVRLVLESFNQRQLRQAPLQALEGFNRKVKI